MAIYKRKLSNGKESSTYYCQYTTPEGKRKTKNTGHTNFKKAKTWEKDFLGKLRTLKTEKAIISEFSDARSGRKEIHLEDAWDEFIKKSRSLPMGKKQEEDQLMRWKSFLDFLSKDGTCKVMSGVDKNTADRFIAHVHGLNISNRTKNAYHKAVKRVFADLKEHLPNQANPFDEFEFLKDNFEEREAYTDEELKLIFKNLAGNAFLYPLFLTGLYTGLRLGDICKLMWSQVNLKKCLIICRMSKTDKTIEIPIHAKLAEHLQKIERTSEYVFPEQAAMYDSNPSGVSYRVNEFLSGIGIQTNTVVSGRKRPAQKKDFHSLRHTFAFQSGMSGMPLPVIQSIVGHMSPTMTKRYTDHASQAEKQIHINKLPVYGDKTKRKSSDKKVIKEVKKKISAIKPGTLQEFKTSLQEILSKY